MDGSTHRWFGNEKSCLVAIIDNATSELHAAFFDSETTQGCMKVIRLDICTILISQLHDVDQVIAQI